MQAHRGLYFWMRAVFQIIAFSFLIVTLLMLINFRNPLWRGTLSLLTAKHCFDFVSYSLDLLAFSSQNTRLFKYKLVLDVISLALIIVVQIILLTRD